MTHVRSLSTAFLRAMMSRDKCKVNYYYMYIVITSRISGRGNRIGPVCLCAYVCMCVCVCVSLCNLAVSWLNRSTYGHEF